MDILLMGGTGAIGISLVNILVQNGNNVYITTRKKRENAGNIFYIQGNAHDMEFMQKVLKERSWGAVIDFMSYSTKEFEERYELFLENTAQYVFTSSARVYAQSDDLIIEQSDRLLDVCTDQEYLKTDEYALTKARQENMLINCAKKNWTIIRPSVTYNSNRLQLGVLEKEHWLYRALKGRTIVFSEDIGSKLTALTNGYDVSKGYAAVIGEQDALGRAFHITDPKSYTWLEILNIYLDLIEEFTGKRPSVKITDETSCFKIGWNKYQIIYCRYYNRTFDNSAISQFTDVSEFCDVKTGIRMALNDFFAKPAFSDLNWRLEGVNDKICGEHTPLSEMKSTKAKVQYILYRYLPSGLANSIFKVLQGKR